MINRCIPVAVLLGFIATRLALIPHAHAGLSAEECVKHDAAPHIHCQGKAAHKHSHEKDEFEGHHAVKTSDSLCIQASPDEFDHDNNAIATSLNTYVSDLGSNQHQLSNILDYSLISIEILADNEPSEAEQPAEFVSDRRVGTNTYLTLRALRI